MLRSSTQVDISFLQQIFVFCGKDCASVLWGNCILHTHFTNNIWTYWCALQIEVFVPCTIQSLSKTSLVGKKCVDRQPWSQTFFGAVLPSLTGKMGSAAELLIPLSSSWAIEDFYKQQFKQVKTSTDYSAVQSSLTPHHIPQCSDGAQQPLQTTVQSPLIPHHNPTVQ